MRISDWSSDVCSSDLFHGIDARAIFHHRTDPVVLVDRSAMAELQLSQVTEENVEGELLRFDMDIRNPLRGRIIDQKIENFSIIDEFGDRKSTRLKLQSLMRISYAVFCLKKITHLKHNQTIDISQNEQNII